MPTLATPVKKSKQAFVPTYRRIETSLRDQLQMGVWPAGTMLPGRRELAKQYGVDLNTIQNAIRILVDDGTLRAEGRRGTFVPPTAVPQALARVPAPPAAPITLNAQATVGIVASVHPGFEVDRPSTDAWQTLVIHALEHELGHESGITVSFQNRWAEPLKRLTNATVSAIRNLIAEHVDALVVVSPRPEEIDEVLALADSERLPIVLVTPDYIVNRMVPQIRYDNASAGYLAADHLIHRGYRTITFFAPYTASWGDERLAGIREAVQRSGLSPSALHESECVRTFDAGIVRQEELAYEYGTKLFLEEGWRIDQPGWGIVAINDHAAFGVLDAANEHGLLAGQDFGLISFDDLSEARTRGLTSLRAPYDQMGAEAGRMIRQSLGGGKMAMSVSLQSSIAARKSTLPVGRRN